MLLKIDLQSMKLTQAVAFPAPLRDMVMTRDGLAMLLYGVYLEGANTTLRESLNLPIWAFNPCRA